MRGPVGPMVKYSGRLTSWKDKSAQWCFPAETWKPLR